MMRAIILDYSDGTVVLLDIPKEHELNADDYVRNVIDPDECEWMVVPDDATSVYRLTRHESDGNVYDEVCEI